MHENRETSEAPRPEREGGRSAKAQSHTADAHAPEESDRAILSMNQPNKEEGSSAEAGEKRARAKENICLIPHRPDTVRGTRVPGIQQCGAALVSSDGAGRSIAHRERQDQRYATVSLSGPSAAAEEQDRTASEAALRGVVPSRVRRAALRLDQHVRGRGRGGEPPDAAGLLPGPSAGLRAIGAGVDREPRWFSLQL